ncbi:MAG TPA: adenylate/guanylate cyclase domain-containing protein [Saprospiraceae bacterium]|nr:adenylate/guanylate cyclase domain-containing protein [Saprospiraceae bacterium]
MNSHKRHLAAILFTDVHGINPGIEATDQTALQWRKLYHNVLIAHHEVFGGRIVNYYGHGSISLFGCTLDAVRCARAMQREFQALGRGKVRMGLHVGEVLDEMEDVSGASVNLAARIQTLGVPGSVVFSDIVYAQIRNQPEFQVISLGKFAVKNITNKVCTYALKEKDLVVPSRLDILRSQHINMLRLLMRAPVQAMLLLGRLVYSSLS